MLSSSGPAPFIAWAKNVPDPLIACLRADWFVYAAIKAGRTQQALVQAHAKCLPLLTVPSAYAELARIVSDAEAAIAKGEDTHALEEEWKQKLQPQLKEWTLADDAQRFGKKDVKKPPADAATLRRAAAAVARLRQANKASTWPSLLALVALHIVLEREGGNVTAEHAHTTSGTAPGKPDTHKLVCDDLRRALAA